ncbi:hypothetical protein D9756_008475 [Leucocoprinus leucothites]|uniref:Uncharacterized protein n=1 Tax=Leucocoprinus leucothites TaxID=201217 RepID=A0A8H5FUX7_9AGAR|nr:hypothetical protein D9756_008475 [Leucoagaricus leucothites]
MRIRAYISSHLPPQQALTRDHGRFPDERQIRHEAPFQAKKILSRLVILHAAVNLIILPLAFPFLKRYAGNRLSDIEFILIYALPPLSILVHNIARLWTWRYWVVIIEVLYSLIEISGLVMSLVFPFLLKFFRHMWSTYAPDIIQTISSFLLAIYCMLSFIGLLWDIWSQPEPWKYKLLKEYDFFEAENRDHIHRDLILGTTPWKPRSRTENRVLVGIRGGIAIFCLLLVGMVAFYALLARPANLLSIPRRIPFRSYWYSSSNWMSVIPTHAILVFSGLHSNVSLPLNEILHISSVNQSASCADDIVYTIDFSHIPGFSPSFVASFYLGVNDTNVDDILEATEPTALLPGIRLFGTLGISRRELMSNFWATALALPQRRRIIVANIRSLMSDPSIVPPPNNQSASLRVRLLPTRPSILIEQATPEDSVLEGFALLGGVWTTVNGMFAITFGSTLLLVLFGIKPLSVYGLIHLLPGQKHSLLDEECGVPIREKRDLSIDKG